MLCNHVFVLFNLKKNVLFKTHFGAVIKTVFKLTLKSKKKKNNNNVHHYNTFKRYKLYNRT